MEHLIDKDAVVAEIERKINEIKLDTIEDWRYRLQREHDIEVMKNILSLINTFEVKDVGLEREINDYFITVDLCQGEKITENTFRRIAKHFFELGLSVKNPINAADRGMVEKIIIILKRLENDYHIDLNVETAVSLVIREMERLRNSEQKGE